MNTIELKNAYDNLYQIMEESKDVSKMRMFGTAFTQLFNQVAEKHPEMATAIIEMLAAIEYNNYITMAEATEVTHKFLNDDTLITGLSEPSKGAHWSMESLKSFLQQKGLSLEDQPYYNWYALWVTVNMMYSDFANALVDLLGTKDQEHLAVACYKLALRKLKDADRPAFIRDYFHLD